MTLLPMTVSMTLIQLQQAGLVHLSEYMPVITVAIVMPVTEQLPVTIELRAPMLMNVPTVYQLQVQLTVVQEHASTMMAVTPVHAMLDLNSMPMKLFSISSSGSSGLALPVIFIFFISPVSSFKRSLTSLTVVST